MHELTHYRRGDLWMKLASAVAESLYWFNPMIRFITANCAGEMELSCDEATLAGLGEAERVTYGEAVLAIVKNGKKKQNRVDICSLPKIAVPVGGRRIRGNTEDTSERIHARFFLSRHKKECRSERENQARLLRRSRLR